MYFSFCYFEGKYITMSIFIIKLKVHLNLLEHGNQKRTGTELFRLILLFE